MNTGASRWWSEGRRADILSALAGQRHSGLGSSVVIEMVRQSKAGRRPARRQRVNLVSAPRGVGYAGWKLRDPCRKLEQQREQLPVGVGQHQQPVQLNLLLLSNLPASPYLFLDPAGDARAAPSGVYAVGGLRLSKLTFPELLFGALRVAEVSGGFPQPCFHGLQRPSVEVSR